MEKEFKLGATEVVIDGTTATVNVEPGAFMNNTDISEKEFKAAFAYMKHYQQEMATAATNEAIGLFKKNKDLEIVDVISDYGIGKSGSLRTRIKKEVTFKNPTTGEAVSKPFLTQTVSHNSFKNKTHLKKCSDIIKDALTK